MVLIHRRVELARKQVLIQPVVYALHHGLDHCFVRLHYLFVFIDKLIIFAFERPERFKYLWVHAQAVLVHAVFYNIGYDVV